MLTSVLRPGERNRAGFLGALKRRAGAALVELALVLMVLVLLLLGIIDIGYVFFVQHNMVNAARDAARVIAVRDGVPGQGIQAARDRLNGIPLEFNIDVEMPQGNNGNGNGGGNPNDRDVTVTITTPLSAASFGLLSGNMRAEATMRLEGEEE
jgi:hypothetical protein